MTEDLNRRFELDDPSIASVVDELSLWSARFGILLLDHLQLQRGIRILDLGCASGFPLFELAHLHGSSCQLVGVDVWAEAIDRASTKLETYELENVRLVRGDAAHLPLDASSFDLIVSNLGINNFADPRATLVECARVTKPGGRIVLTTNVKGHMQEFYDVFRETLVALGRADRLERLTDNEDHRLSRTSISDLLGDCGFEVTRAIEDRFEMRFLDGSAFLRHFLIVIGFLGGWREVIDSMDEGDIFAEIEKKLNAVAAKEGQLRMSIPMLYLEGRR
jgi:arsenite methyltransferase